MKKKLVLELYMYDDGDWGYDESIFKNHTSQYFDNDLYEYSNFSDYSTRIRRVFEYSHTGLTELCDMLEKVRNTAYGQESDKPKRFIDDALCELYTMKKKIDRDTLINYSRHYERNTEIELDVLTVKTEAKKIKKIIYEE